MSWRSEEAERQKVVEEEEQQDDGHIGRLMAANPHAKETVCVRHSRYECIRQRRISG